MSASLPLPKFHCPMCGERFSELPERCSSCGETLSGDEVDEAFWIDPKLVRLFHNETRWLGGMWIFFGLWPLVFGASELILAIGNTEIHFLFFEYVIVSGVAVLIGLLFIGLGIACRSKKFSGIVIGLLLGYLSMLLCLASLNLCSILICVVVLVQTHTVLRTAKRMRKLGIPLNTPIPGQS